MLVDDPCGAGASGCAPATAGTDGAFERLFAPWPLRFYVIAHGRLTFIAEPQKCTYDLSLLRKHLLRLLRHTGGAM